MRRLIPSGTPSRTNRYVYSRRKWTLFALSALASLGVAVLLLLGAFLLARPLASPGAVSASHAPFEKKCAVCHGPKVSDTRCEHCHDPLGTGRLENAGHVWFGTRDPAAVAKAVSVECARCHTDHRGRKFSIAGEDDRQCRSCHFPSLARHPEFALVKAAVQLDQGLQFSHKKHLARVQKAKLDDCLFCHEPTRDRHAFSPPSFDLHCARCHLPGGSLGATDPIPPETVLLPQDIGEPWSKAHARGELDAKGWVVPKLSHKDPWVLHNLWRLFREIDPGGAAQLRGQLNGRISDLTAQLSSHGRSPFSPPALAQEERRLSRELASQSGRTATPSERARTRRALALIRVQLELGPAPLAGFRPGARSQLETALRQAEADLASLTESGTPKALSAEEKEKRLAALAALTAPCALCHVYDGPRMKPVRAGVSMLTRADYNHLPHLKQMACAACHTNIAESKKAEDVNLPGIQYCRSCHHSGRSRADCAECHTYHPQAEPWPPV